MAMKRNMWVTCLCLVASLALPGRSSAPGELKVSYAFQKSGTVDCQMALTKDSVGVLEIDSTAGSLEPDDEKGLKRPCGNAPSPLPNGIRPICFFP